MKRTRLVVAVLIAFGLACVVWMGDASAKTCSVGDKAQVLWKGKWYPAQVMQVKGSQCYIHYDGYSNSWDEWVGPSRIKITGTKTVSTGASIYPPGTSVQVKWKGKWYPARVKKAGNNSWYIHYDGYSNSWDEWVGPSRIRK
jgi:hypothetical protein